MRSGHAYYTLTTPCKHCPFRHDIEPYLNPERVEEIEQALVRSDFPCHKTTVAGEEDEEGNTPMLDGTNARHCAGALILMEKEGRPSQMMRIAERIGMYDRTKLNMDAPVFDSFEEMIDAQPKRGERYARRRA